MRFSNSALAVFAPLALVLCLSLSGFADPPARIGRLNYLSGSVSFRPGDLDDWTSAAINVPLKTGDHLWTDTGSRAEIHVGSAAIRLNSETALAFLNLDDQTTQIRLTQGALNVRLRQLGDGETFEVDTPNAAVSLLRPGVYRVNVDAQGNMSITDRLGESEVTAMGSAFTVHPHEVASVMGTDMPTYDIQAALPPDNWDNWCAARDRREEQAASVRYVSREMVGYEDLDDYGVWRPVPGYGVVWVPSGVPVGWAPYRFGHWMWVEPWGWTWVDDMPWGFAPFHYGRWAHTEGTWVWVPGTLVARPVYAPALVAFVGGSNWHVSLSIGGGVAWFPLGPREVYVPAYRASNTYIRNVNVTHVNVTNINVTNVNVVNTTYVNRSVPGAVTAVPQETFVRAQTVSKAAVVVPPQNVATAPISGMTAAVAPRQESVAGKTSASVTVVRPPAQAVSRTVVVRNTPAPQPVPFAARQYALDANPGQPLAPEKAASLRPNAAPVPSLVKPAVPPAASNVQESSTLKPARQSLQAKHPVAPAASAPNPNATSSVNEANRPNPKPPAAQNDRPNRAPAIAPPAPEQPQQRERPAETPSKRNDVAKPEPKPAPPAPASGQIPSAHQERPVAPPHPQAAPVERERAERGARPERPKGAEEKTKAKPAESEKSKGEDR